MGVTFATAQLLDTSRYVAIIRDVSVMQDDLQERIRLAPGALIGARIRRARRQAELSHDKLGEALGGVTRQHLIKLEKAQHRPRAEMLTRIAMALDKPLDYFLVEEAGEPNPFPAEAA